MCCLCAFLNNFFSWDSLVHADKEVMAAYLGEIARVQRPGGRAFIHHSNLAACKDGDYPKHARDPGVSAAWVVIMNLEENKWAVGLEAVHETGGLRVVSQEVVDWGGTGHLIDCFTVLERSDDRPYPPPKLVENCDFMAEAHAARRIAELYGKL